jgi:uncharacterized membrane protein
MSGPRVTEWLSVAAAKRSCRRLAVLLAIAALPALLLLAPTGAWASGSYSIPDCAITSTIATNGDLSVHVAQTFTFNGSFTRVYWTLPKKGTGGIRIGGVAVGGKALALTDVSAPPPGTYRVTDEGADVLVEAYGDFAHRTATLTLDYRALHAATRWADTAELYFKFIGDTWAVPMGAVSVAVTPPPGVSSSDTRAWAHGPLYGTVTIQPDATVLLKVAPLPARTMVEARLAFPAAALSALPLGTQPRLQTILSEEKVAADQANAARRQARDELATKRTLKRVGLVGGIVLALAGLVFFAVMYRRFGREFEPSLPGEYYRDIPADLPPSAVQYLWRTGSIDDKSITATLLDLANKGVVGIDQVSHEEHGFLHDKETVTYRLTRAATGTDSLDPGAAALLSFLFDTAGDGHELLVSGLRDYAKAHRREFVEAHKTWKAAATDAAEGRGFFDPSSRRAARIVSSVGVAVLALSVLLVFVTSTLWALVALPVGIVLLVGARAVNRRTRDAEELYAKYHGLYRYMKDFGRMQEKPPTAVVLWEQYLVLATVFGIADEVIRDMKVVVPEVVDDPTFRASYWWVVVPHGGMPSFTSAFSQSMAAAVASSTASSGSGAGGGFSGGGGFGGGGMGGGVS